MPLAPTIGKRLGERGPAPNLADYDAARASFSWAAARGALDGLPGGTGINIAHECVDRHAAGPRATRVALRFLGRGRGARPHYADLAAATTRFANVHDGLGVGAGGGGSPSCGSPTVALRRRAGDPKHVGGLHAVLVVRSRAVRQRLSLGDSRCS